MESSRTVAWTRVVAFTGLIYATLPVGPSLWRATVRGLGPWQDLLVLGTLAVMIVGIVGVALRGGPTPTIRTAAGLVGVAGGYLTILALVSLTPAEKLHFLYYGILALLVHRALSLELQGGSISALTVVLVAAIGLGDEGIQHLLPNRFFEWKDVALNAVSGFLATALIVFLTASEPR